MQAPLRLTAALLSNPELAILGESTSDLDRWAGTTPEPPSVACSIAAGRSSATPTCSASLNTFAIRW